MVCIVLSIGAILGNAVGYEIGRRAGPAIFTRPDSRLFSQHNVERAHAFFERYGALAIVLARFVPIVRTFITVVAGVGRMDRRLYLAYSAHRRRGLGQRRSRCSATALGHITFVRQHIQPHLDLILIGVVLVSILAGAAARVPRPLDRKLGAPTNRPNPWLALSERNPLQPVVGRGAHRRLGRARPALLDVLHPDLTGLTAGAIYAVVFGLVFVESGHRHRVLAARRHGAVRGRAAGGRLGPAGVGDAAGRGRGGGGVHR